VKNRRGKGTLVERRVREYLESKGMTVVKNNYRCRFGEVDIIARDGGTLVFVEVRSRWNNPSVNPEEFITREKTRRLYRVAEHYLQNVVKREISSRFDLITVNLDEIGNINSLKHLRAIM